MATVNLYVRPQDQEAWNRLSELALAEGRSMSWAATQAVREYLERHEQDGS